MTLSFPTPPGKAGAWLVKWSRTLWKLALDLLFPQPFLVQYLQSLKASRFLEEVMLGVSPQALLEWQDKQERLALEDDVLVLFPYRAPLGAEAIHQLKYMKNPAIAELLAQCFSLALKKHFDLAGTTVIIPAPISTSRLRERGYNQIHFLLTRQWCDPSAEHSYLVDTTILRKNRDTEKQSQTDTREARLKNLKGAFTVTNSQKITGATILLVDDVYTTGSTVHEMRATLIRAGAKRVIALCLAH